MPCLFILCGSFYVVTRERVRAKGFLSTTTTDKPLEAVSILIGSLFLLAFQDGLVKLTSADVSLWQFHLIRSVANLLVLFVLTRTIWTYSQLKPQRPWAVVLRSLLLTIQMVCFFGGVPFLTLAEIAAGFYIFPLIVVVMSAVMLRERVDTGRIVVILIGFSGTLFILKPGTEAFRPISLMPIGAAFCYAGTIITTRYLCREESPIALSFGVNIAFLFLGIFGILVFSGLPDGQLSKTWPYLFTGWNELSMPVFGIILACSVLNLFANIGTARAYQNAKSSWLAPFDYSYMIFAALWGFILWGAIPDHYTILGMTMIGGAGIFLAFRKKDPPES
jgi:drug/metabolite transporter (DMT)-like permease